MTLQIRHSEPADIPAIRDLYAQPSCLAATLQLPHPSLTLWERRLGNPPDHFTSLVALREGRLLGQVGIEVFTAARRRHVANIGMAVCEDARRQGVGRALVRAAKAQCFGWLGVRRIELECYVDNAGALALYESEGFVVEGTARGYALREGEYVDVHLMACAKD
ncbi:GNAT family N-acetyltransferase [Pseudomarimonas salicorniae]|uniref:GNAT family N-acetyltransferase n=1 Tax=Pseudomarimonas salicorniae TaxID=2933270 RepID=A0ABT0GDW9_9GAMM|nr:GNAT family N-acetyltransferase [Lysobacter sp. CAU 1642]MCK7592633.1 GNAT family N-acetyltransferase [Lysobacter sp. CAU 1642]